MHRNPCAAVAMKSPGIRFKEGLVPTTSGNRGRCPLFRCRSTDIRWLATVTGRLGVAFNSTLLYVKGGWAWANENLQNACDICNGGAVLWQSADNRNGGTVGVGVEYGFTPNWSAKLEYDYIAFGKQNVGTFTNAAGFSPFTEDIRQNINLVKVGANYRFGGPVVAQY